MVRENVRIHPLSNQFLFQPKYSDGKLRMVSLLRCAIWGYQSPHSSAPNQVIHHPCAFTAMRLSHNDGLFALHGMRRRSTP